MIRNLAVPSPSPSINHLMKRTIGMMMMPLPIIGHAPKKQAESSSPPSAARLCFSDATDFSSAEKESNV